MRSYGKGSKPATTKVKVSSPEIILIALGQGFHFLETKIDTHAKGECAIDMSGSKSVAGKRKCLYWNLGEPKRSKRSFQKVEEAMRKYGDSVVGLARSRGVNRVMPIESSDVGTLEGVSSLMQRGRVCYAIH